MRYLTLLVAIFFLLVLQAGVLAEFGLSNLGNLVLLFVVISIMSGDLKEGLFVALLAGIMLDFISGTVDGTLILVLITIFGFTRVFITKFIPKESSPIVLLSSIALNTVLFALSFLIINKFFTLIKIDSAADWKFVLGMKLVWDLLINLIFAYPIFWFYNLLSGKFKFTKT